MPGNYIPYFTMDPVPRSPATTTATARGDSRRRRAISNAQRRALRAWFFSAPTGKTQAAAAWGWQQRYGYYLNSSTVSEIISYKYDMLDDTGLLASADADGGEDTVKTVSSGMHERERGRKRQRAAKWEDLEEALIEWVFGCETQSGKAVAGSVLRQRAAELWQEMPCYQGSPMPKWSEGWRTRFKARYNIRKAQMLRASSDEDGGGRQLGGGGVRGYLAAGATPAARSINTPSSPPPRPYEYSCSCSSGSTPSTASAPLSSSSSSSCASSSAGYPGAPSLAAAPSIRTLGGTLGSSIDDATILDTEMFLHSTTWPSDMPWQDKPLAFGGLPNELPADFFSSWLLSLDGTGELSMETSLPLLDDSDDWAS